MSAAFTQETDSLQAADDTPGSESTSTESIFTTSRLFMDFDYLATGLKNHGWGFGVTTERNFFKYFSIEGKFGHMTVFDENWSNACVTVGLEANAYYYPFGRGLEWLYLGGGCSTDFLMLTSDDVPEDEKSQTAIYLTGKAGWKQNLGRFFWLDLFCGYKYLLSDVKIPEDYSGLITKGFVYGVKFRLNGSNIIKAIKK